jgi:hypothetical protein
MPKQPAHTRHQILLPPGLFAELSHLHGNIASARVIRVILEDHARKRRAGTAPTPPLSLNITLEEEPSDE